MKDFEALWRELNDKAGSGDSSSATVTALNSGVHAIAKKVLEEAGEVFAAADHQSKEELASEISQLLYWIQVLMISRDVSLADVYRRL